jgi:hypothetical protein
MKASVEKQSFVAETMKTCVKVSFQCLPKMRLPFGFAQKCQNPHFFFYLAIKRQNPHNGRLWFQSQSLMWANINAMPLLWQLFPHISDLTLEPKSSINLFEEKTK